MVKLPPIEAKILTVLIKDDDYMNTQEVAKGAEISWNTALAYLKKFERRGWVERIGDIGAYWKAIIND